MEGIVRLRGELAAATAVRARHDRPQAAHSARDGRAVGSDASCGFGLREPVHKHEAGCTGRRRVRRHAGAGQGTGEFARGHGLGRHVDQDRLALLVLPARREIPALEAALGSDVGSGSGQAVVMVLVLPGVDADGGLLAHVCLPSQLRCPIDQREDMIHVLAQCVNRGATTEEVQ